jgi:MFS family permease
LLLGNQGTRWYRIVPVASVMYTIAYMDRVNIGFAGPGMAHDFHVNAAVVGSTFGAISVGSALLQIPSGYVADRLGSKLLVTLLLIAWAAFAVYSGLAQTVRAEWWARFFLGVAEGGLWPAVLVMIARWFPRDERASANALFQISLPLGSLISALLSGWLVSLFSWRYMLILEGLPPLIWAVLWWLAIEDSPSRAKWLPDDERIYLAAKLEKERLELPSVEAGVAWRAMFHPVVWLITLTYYLALTGSYGLIMWMPTLVKDQGVGTMEAGWLLMIPNFVAIFALIYAGRLSDRLQNRKIVVFGSFIGVLLGLFGLIYLQYFHIKSVSFTILFMTIAISSAFAKQAPLWAIPTQILPKGSAGLGMAVIGLIGGLGGLTGPWLMGYLRDMTHSFMFGYVALAACTAGAAFTALCIPESKPLNLAEFSLTFWRRKLNSPRFGDYLATSDNSSERQVSPVIRTSE